MKLIRKLKSIFLRNHLYLILILTLLFALILGMISYQELQREKNYLWELAYSEGLNIAFSIQSLGSEFILDRNILKEVLHLFRREGIAFIDILDHDGNVRISTNQQRINGQIVINHPDRINYIQTYDEENNDILQVIKPFDFGEHLSSDLFGYIFLKDKYLLVGINLENYYLRFSQIKQRVILNYLIILMICLLGVYMIFRIQESLVTKKTLKNMKDYTTKLLETIDSGVISVNRQGMIKTFNRKSEQIFQLKRNEVIDKNAEEVLPIYLSENSIYQLGLKKEEKIETEIVFMTKNHVKKVLEINTSLLSDENDRVGGMVILARDISRLKKLSEEMNRNKRLASLGKLSSGIAHEIRNPLSSIRGLAQFLNQSLSPDDERKADFKIILKEVDRLNQLINQVLDFSRPKKLNISRFSIQGLIKELIHLLELENKGKNISFKFLVGQKNITIAADRDQIRQALLNVLLNSIQAIEKEGEINISLKEKIDHDTNFLQISIEDTGVGIDSANLSHIFDPFFTTRNSGSGLGLSISYNLVEIHNGSIKVESEEGKGTKVEILIPLRRGENFE